jgi:pimeloyl-ACP methyl ester carboxylesterase
MTEHMSGDSDADDRFVRLDDGDMHVVADGKPAAPALLLIHGTGASTAWWARGRLTPKTVPLWAERLIHTRISSTDRSSADI